MVRAECHAHLTPSLRAVSAWEGPKRGSKAHDSEHLSGIETKCKDGAQGPQVGGILVYISSHFGVLLLSSTFLSSPDHMKAAPLCSRESGHGISKIRMFTQYICPNMSNYFMQLREEMFLYFFHSAFSPRYLLKLVQDSVTMGVTKSKNDSYSKNMPFPKYSCELACFRIVRHGIYLHGIIMFLTSEV